MNYVDGIPVHLGDIVNVNVGPSVYAEGRVVMLGDTHEHICSDEPFVEWTLKKNLLNEQSIIVEWTRSNPFAHEDSNLAPVGNRIFVEVDHELAFVRRGE